ncbi:MAG: hypothetical protein OXI24_17105 [Candidatus Poribacteria bacterium]|nr:hypothetical protein [Candidatus Poribacteria bacterium]
MKLYPFHQVDGTTAYAYYFAYYSIQMLDFVKGACFKYDFL